MAAMEQVKKEGLSILGGRVSFRCRTIPRWIPAMGCWRTALPVHIPMDVCPCRWVWAERSGMVNSMQPPAGPPKARLWVRCDCCPAGGVGYQMSSEEIGDLYQQIYALKRLPRPPPCGPERAQKITAKIMSSLKDCLRQRTGEQSGGGGDPESASTHPSCHCNWASQRGRWDTSGEWELAEARKPISGPGSCCHTGGMHRET